MHVIDTNNQQQQIKNQQQNQLIDHQRLNTSTTGSSVIGNDDEESITTAAWHKNGIHNINLSKSIKTKSNGKIITPVITYEKLNNDNKNNYEFNSQLSSTPSPSSSLSSSLPSPSSSSVTNNLNLRSNENKNQFQQDNHTSIIIEDISETRSSSKNSFVANTYNNNNNNSSSSSNSNNNNNDNINSNNNNDNDDKNSSKSSISLHSNRISIVSLNDDDIDSSVIDSDEDFDDPVAIPIGNNSNYIVKKLSEHHNPNIKNDGVIVINQKYDGLPSEINTNADCNGIVTSTTASSNKPQIGSIAVQNSTDITFGNKTFYQGPVTIKQFVLEKKNNDIPKSSSATKENGKDNPAFETDDNLDENQRNNNHRYGINSEYFFKKRIAALSAASLLIVVVIGALVFTVLAFVNKGSYKNPGDGDDSRKNIPINSTIGDDNISDGSILRIITRDEWLAQPPLNELADLELPSNRVIIAHTATEGCNTQAACTFRVRFIQTFHIESRNFDDIGYNFLVGGDGSVYEGRGWDKEGAHTKGYNKRSICVAFIGTFISIEPPEKQLKAAQLIIQEGVRLGKLTPDYKLYGHRQLIASESPGETLYKIIQSWSHWTNEL